MPNSVHPRQPGHCCSSRETKKTQCQHQRSEGRVPYPMNRPVPDIGIKRPRPGRPQCNARAEGPVRNQEYRNSGERCKKAIDRQQYPCGCVSVDAKNLEDSANQVGIERWLPGGGTGIASIRIAETLPQSDRTADAAHLKAEAEVIFSGASAILAENSDRHQLQKKRKQHHPQHRSRHGWEMRSFHHRGVYQV